jgi:epoxyqueuosine reductase QueG
VMLAEDILQPVLRKNPCCSAWTILTSSLREREMNFFARFLPDAKTAVVLGHHITTKDEWKWYVDEDGSEHCSADDHAANVCGQIKDALGVQGYRAGIVPYPGESGLQFRAVAEAAGAGRIGMNVFLLHPLWGPWIQLRVLATDAPSRFRPVCRGPVCTRCGECISACPAGAIREDSFEGLQCRRYRTEKGEYLPSGPERELRYCSICADVCPIGKKPE